MYRHNFQHQPTSHNFTCVCTKCGLGLNKYNMGNDYRKVKPCDYPDPIDAEVSRFSKRETKP